MITISAKIRDTFGSKLSSLRKRELLPAIVYGPLCKKGNKFQSIPLQLSYRDFEKVYEKAGESSLIELRIERANSKEDRKRVLLRDIAKDPLTGKFLHVDFFEPLPEEKVEATIPLVFVGESEAVKNLEGTLVKDIPEIEVRALPQNLPHQIEIDITPLKTFHDKILVKDIKVPKGVEILKEPDETIASVSPPKKEEEVKKPEEEAVEEKPEEEVAEEGAEETEKKNA